MMKFSNRQRAYHQQVLKEVYTMVTMPTANVKPSNTKDHDWAARKLDNLLSNCKG